MPLPSLKTTTLFRYRFGYIRNGKRHLVTPWKDNLIQDCGLDKIASLFFASCWQACLFGTAVSPVPTRRNTGAVTVSQSGTTATASGAYFIASDVGRLFKFDSGEEAYVTVFTSSTVVTLSISRTVSTSPGTMWYVNETGLTSVFSTTSTYGANAGDNGTSVVANVVTDKRTFVGIAVVGSQTFTEIGFNNSTANTNVFDRDIITGGVTLITGDQPLAVATMIRTFTPASATVEGNVGTGCDTSGSEIISGLAGGGYSYVATDGTTQDTGPDFFEPSAIGSNNGGVITTTFAMPAFNNGNGPNLGTFVAADSSSNPAYSAGNFFRDLIINFDVSSIVGNIFALGIQKGGGGAQGFIHRFTTPIAKSGLQTFTYTFRKNWQRILTN